MRPSSHWTLLEKAIALWEHPAHSSPGQALMLLRTLAEDSERYREPDTLSGNQLTLLRMELEAKGLVRP